MEPNDDPWSNARCSQDFGHLLKTQAATYAQVEMQLETQVYTPASHENDLETQPYALACHEDRLEPVASMAAPSPWARDTLKSVLKRKQEVDAWSIVW